MAFDLDQLSVSAARSLQGNIHRDLQANIRRGSRPPRRSLRRSLCLAIAVGIAACLFAPDQAVATDTYLVKPMQAAFDNPATMRRMLSAAKKYAYAPSIDKFADVQYARVYYQEYLPARITQPDGRNEISDLMTDVRKRMSRAYRAGTPGSKNIMRWLYSGMRPIAEGNFHPAARINAILLISRLDVVPADPSARKPPVPSPVIPHVLFPLYQDASNSDGVRAAALNGLRRYANLAGDTLKKTQQDALIAEMQRLLRQDSPADRDVLAHAYLQRFAVDILISLNSLVDEKGDTDLGSYLVSVSTDRDKHQSLSIHAAARLSTVDRSLATTDGRVTAILFSWSSLATDAVGREIERLDAMTRPEPVSPQPASPDASAHLNRNGARDNPQRGQMNPGQMQEPLDAAEMDGGGEDDNGMMGPGMGRAMMPGGGRSIQAHEVVMSRRKLNFVFQQLQLGAAGTRTGKLPSQPHGLLVAVAAADRPVVQNWIVSLQQIVRRINSPELFSRERYLAELKNQQAVLQEIVVQFAPVPAQQLPAGPPELPGKLQGGVPGQFPRPDSLATDQA